MHKHRRWRDFLKGLYAARSESQRILVTGSGRLELFGFGGDSLQGRYHLLRLHPFTVAEAGIEDANGLAELLRLGGFPEPFLGGSEAEVPAQADVTPSLQPQPNEQTNAPSQV